MTLNKGLALALLASALTSCNGVKSSSTNSGGGNATLLITLTATPLTPPPNTNLLSFSVTLGGISLTPSTGGAAVDIPLNSTTYSVDLTRLQSDSVFVASSKGVPVPAGTYSGMTVSLSNPVVTYCTQTTGATGCSPGSVASVSSGGPAVPKITTSPFPLSLVANQTTGLAVNINLSNALTVNANQVVSAVNLAATDVLSANALPPTASNLPSGELSFLEDVTGVVTSVTASTQSVTVKTATLGSFTATANSSTVFSPNCTNFNLSLSFSSCVVQGQVASLDLLLTTTGAFTLLEYDPLATSTGDWLEGIITSVPSSSTQFQLVTNNVVLTTTNTLLGSVALATPVNVSLLTPKPFVVDSKGLVIPITVFNGAADTSVLAPGQTVAVHVTAFTAASGSTLATASVDSLYLRFTRVTGSLVSSAPPNTFSAQSFPPFFALNGPIVVQLSSGSPNTNFDGVSGASNLTASQTVSINALYFGPPVGITATPSPFSAAKVRVP